VDCTSGARAPLRPAGELAFVVRAALDCYPPLPHHSTPRPRCPPPPGRAHHGASAPAPLAVQVTRTPLHHFYQPLRLPPVTLPTRTNRGISIGSIRLDPTALTTYVPRGWRDHWTGRGYRHIFFTYCHLFYRTAPTFAPSPHRIPLWRGGLDGDSTRQCLHDMVAAFWCRLPHADYLFPCLLSGGYSDINVVSTA